ncbi:MAG: phage holin family protein [Acidobacteriaceae bacterium]|jgi:peptidoglycan/LPS O-acetylase OafA/YrhL
MATQERSISDVLQDIVGNIQEIIRSEVRLAKGELRDESIKVKAAAPLLVIGAVGGLLAAFFLAWAGFYALSLIVPMWAAALIVAAVLGLVGGLTVSAGMKALHRVNPPQHTIASVKENVQWVKQQVK